jgi:hypothetical protein
MARVGEFITELNLALVLLTHNIVVRFVQTLDMAAIGRQKRRRSNLKRGRFMRYDCGHDGCDVCGTRACKRDVTLHKYQLFNPHQYEVLICDWCLKKAVKLAVQMSETFGGVMIDLQKPCKNKGS